MNSFKSIFSKIFNTDLDANHKEQLLVETFPYFKILLDVSLLDHLLHGTAALVKSMSTK